VRICAPATALVLFCYVLEIDFHLMLKKYPERTFFYFLDGMLQPPEFLIV